MRLKTLHVACALACASLSGHAMAQATFGAFATPDINLFKGGASATQNTFGGIAVQLFANIPGGVTGSTTNTTNITAGEDYFVYYNDAGTNPAGTLYRSYLGRVRNVSSIVIGTAPNQTTIQIPLSIRDKLLLVQDRTDGGSVFGVNPVARGEGIRNMNVSAGTCTTTAAITGVQYLCASQGEDITGSTAAPNRIPDFGLSDVEPAMFKAPINVEFGATQLTATELARFTGTTFPGFQLAFDVPVNEVTGTDVTTLPNIPAAMYASMLNGAVKSWTDIPGVSTSISSPAVVVCRRVPGSGSQATLNQWAGKAPCNEGSIVAPSAVPPAGTLASQSWINGAAGSGTQGDPFIINPADGYAVIENSSSGDVRTCLARAKNGGNIDFRAQFDADENGVIDATELFYFRATFGAGGFRATGVLSRDSAAVPADWTFRSLSGLAYSEANMQNGNWDLLSETTYQYRNDNPSYLTAIKRDAINTLIALGQDPNILEGVASSALRAATLAIPSSTRPAGGFNTSRVSSGGNTCRPLQKF